VTIRDDTGVIFNARGQVENFQRIVADAAFSADIPRLLSATAEVVEKAR
jgi:hypothetical protein